MRPDLRRILDDLPGLKAVLDSAADRYVELSRVGGSVEVAPEARRSVERLGCRVDARGRVRLAALDRAFRESRLEAPLPEVLEAYRGEPLVTRSEARALEDAAWNGVLARMRTTQPPEWAWHWVEDAQRALRAEWRRQNDEWSAGLETALRAAGALESVGGPLELPRLAYRVTGDAHGLDPDALAGRMLERLLLHRHSYAGLGAPLCAEDRESLFAMAGLAIDELSSTVHVVGLVGSAPLVAAARQGRHVVALPLRTLYAIGEDIRAHRDVVFAVENRSVLSALHRQLADLDASRYPTLVCTSGHLSLATLRLLDRLCASGAVVRYSGDFDAGGLMIADALASRLGDAVELWRMSPGALDVALAARGATRKLDAGVFAPGARARFPELVSAISSRGAAFQEGLTELLERDVRQWSAEPPGADQRLSPRQGAP